MILPDAARALLQQPLIIRMAVNDPNGYPHIVPVWCGLDGDDVIIFGYRNTRKVGYIQANPKGALQIAGDSAGAGFLLKGEFSIEEDVDHFWAKQITYAYEPTKESADKNLAEWTNTPLIVLRFVTNKVIKV